MTAGFTANDKRGRGFAITFDNGVRVSVQWGENNACSAQDEDTKRSADVEVCAWDTNGDAHLELIGMGGVLAWQTPADVVAFLTEMSTLTYEQIAERTDYVKAERERAYE